MMCQKMSLVKISVSHHLRREFEGVSTNKFLKYLKIRTIVIILDLDI